MLSEFPAFNLFSPTVVDLDSDGSELEIVVALSTGNIHAFTPSTLSNTGKQRTGFPMAYNTVHGQVKRRNHGHNLEGYSKRLHSQTCIDFFLFVCSAGCSLS
jgi:hypothetical protein